MASPSFFVIELRMDFKKKKKEKNRKKINLENK